MLGIPEGGISQNLTKKRDAKKMFYINKIKNYLATSI